MLQDVTSTPLPRLPKRAADSHKGDFGRALLVGGSRGMSGAISLAGLATLRSGAGLVTVVVPRSIQDVVSAFNPCFMTRGVGQVGEHFSNRDHDEVLELTKNATAIGLGPGMGRDEETFEFVRFIYEVEKPMVVDADALNALAENKSSLKHPGGPRILTPHPGEFTRLAGGQANGAQRISMAAELARVDATRNSVIVLKGHETVITDGECYAINHTGNPGMATGGTGDVLTGIVTGLLCQGLSPFDSARLGVHVHGLAGDLAAQDLGQVSLIASDLIDYLPKAFQSLHQES